jgi:hypothetical protein
MVDAAFFGGSLGIRESQWMKGWGDYKWKSGKGKGICLTEPDLAS